MYDLRATEKLIAKTNRNLFKTVPKQRWGPKLMGLNVFYMGVKPTVSFKETLQGCVKLTPINGA